MLNNIAIRFNKKDFEYDVYSLVKAFYPQAQITMFYEGEEEAEGEYGMFLLVAYGSQEDLSGCGKRWYRDFQTTGGCRI